MNFKEKVISTALANINCLAVNDLYYNKKYTYNDLISFANGFQSNNISKKKIGILIDKSADYIAAIFAITLSDCSFIPLDPSLPIERLKFIIDDSQLDCIITNNIFKNHTLLKLVDKQVIDLSRSDKSLAINYETEDLFYTIYTSGTTGTPKGVELTFSGIDNVIQQQINIFELEHSNIYLFLSMNFDASLSDIYCSFLSGSTIFINDEIKKDVNQFIHFVNINEITYIDIPPSFIKLITPEQLPTLKSIVIGGEVADPATVRNYSSYMKVVNVYGPTESTICTSYSICDSSWEKAYIGKPLSNVTYTVFDDNMNIITNGYGELYISGIQLARGYTNPSITKERFIKLNNDTYYKTGDKVFIENDNIEFIGRIDRQIKHNGQLICIEEIEHAINSIYEVKNVSVVYKNRKLYAYYEGDIDQETIKNNINKILPSYMIPQFFINKVIPKTANGKNDSKLLSKVDPLFDKVTQIFKDILEVNEIDENLSFKYLGADSINFIQLQQQLNNIGINIPYSYIMDNNTIEDILHYKDDKTITKRELINSFDFNQINYDKNIKYVDTNKAIITGVTGNLGIHLLNHINGNYDEIYCLIRADSYEIAYSKLLANLENYNFSINFSKLVIIPIKDLSVPNFGLSSELYNYLSKEVSHIYHNSANVNNIKSYKELYNDNVQSTVNILNFSFNKNLKKIYYASTLSVYVSATHNPNAVFYENELLIDNEKLLTGYAQTKWLSDFLMSHFNIRHQIKQFRLGLLVPEKFTDKDKNSFLYQIIESICKTDILPEDNKGISFDLTPIDLAAQLISDISLSIDENHIYNISFNEKVYYNDIIKVLNKQTIPVQEWFSNNKTHLAQLLNILNDDINKELNLFEMTDVEKFIINNSESFLNNIKPFDKFQYLENYINYFNR